MIPHTDPRLTRYALGEMTDAERVAFERELSDADRAEIDAIRALAGTLTTELAAEPMPAGADVDRPMTMPAARTGGRPGARRLLAIAASLAVVGLFGAALLTSAKRGHDVALRQTVAARPSTQVGSTSLGFKRNDSLSAEFSVMSDIQEGGATAVGKDRRLEGWEMRFRERSIDAYKAEPAPSAGQLASSSESSRIGGAKVSRPMRDELKQLTDGRTAVSGSLRSNAEGEELGVTATAGEQQAVAQPQANGTPAAAADASDASGGFARGGQGGGGGPGGGRFGVASVDKQKAEAYYRWSKTDGLAAANRAEEADRKAFFDRIGRESREAPTADSYAGIVENRFIAPVGGDAVSTFGVDVDTASYANVRRFLQNGQRPPVDAIRLEELINYFPTSDAPPSDGRPFATYADVASCPWNPSHQLIRVALKAREVAVDKRPPSNLVFLVDVSGSMSDADKLPLVKRGLQRLVDSLNEDDRVAIVVYAGNSGLALASTNAANKNDIRAAIDKLEAGGSTNGGQGIELAYATAVANFRAGGANRVILCTDGDFNVGVTNREALVAMIQEKAKAGVFLSVFGFGRGNLKDDTMEQLADKGNGQYAYVDSDREAHKVFVEQASGTLVTVAKDVKIQIEFNPATVKRYRLIGYENRALKTEDFANDLKDAGEIGAGHNVVALYEIEPIGSGDFGRPSGEALKYQPAPATTVAPTDGANRTELLTLKLRFKKPDAPLEQGVSELIERTLNVGERKIEEASPDFQFAAAVAGFGLMLRESQHRGTLDWPTVARLAKSGVGADAGGYRAEFIGLVDRAAGLAR